MELYSVIGTKTYKNLLADPKGADPISVNVKPGQGALAAGQLLYRNSSGLYEKAAQANVSTSYDVVVLAEDLAENTGAVADVATAFRAGCFIDGAIFYTAGTPLTAGEKLALRQLNIVTDPDADAAGFASAFSVTYKANGGTGADYVVQEAAGATHTVLANTVTEFTAPSGKAFSKWNTKADGSGTDKAAAATITMSEDVTLYAVWANE